MYPQKWAIREIGQRGRFVGSGKRPVYTCIRSAAAVAHLRLHRRVKIDGSAGQRQRSGAAQWHWQHSVGSAGGWQRQRSGGCAGFGSAAAAELGVGSGSTAAAARVDIQPCRALAAAAQLGSEGVAAAAQRQHHRALSAAAQRCLHSHKLFVGGSDLALLTI